MPMAWFFWIFFVGMIAAAVGFAWWWSHKHRRPKQDYP